VPEYLGDRRTVCDEDDSLVGMALRDSIDSREQPSVERLERLGAGYEVPALLADHPDCIRLPVRQLLAEDPALPLAEVELAEVRLDGRLDAQPGGQWGRRLGGPTQRRDVDRIDRLGRKARAEEVSLDLALLGEWWIGMTIEGLEGRTFDQRLGLAVADQQQVAGSERSADSLLRKAARGNRVLVGDDDGG
jgi:hypothetical protein